MSAHHGYLTFVGGTRLERTLEDAWSSARQWQEELTQENSRLYAVRTPDQVAAAFVLQHLLTIPAQLSAFAAVTGPWRVDLGDLDAPDAPEETGDSVGTGVSVELAPGLYPTRLGFERLVPDDRPPETRLARARTAYERVAHRIAADYPATVKTSSRQRFGMVEDMWEQAVREAHAATGASPGLTSQRRSCCFIYALPGLHECAGCPRTGVSTAR